MPLGHHGLRRHHGGRLPKRPRWDPSSFRTLKEALRGGLLGDARDLLHGLLGGREGGAGRLVAPPGVLEARAGRDGRARPGIAQQSGLG